MRRSGQALVEFALAITVFMLLVVGTFDMARAYLASIVVANCVREVSRYAAGHANTNDPQHPDYLADVRTAGANLAVGLDTSQLTLTANPVPPIGVAQTITATGGYTFHSLTPLLRVWWGDPINISSRTSTPVG